MLLPTHMRVVEVDYAYPPGVPRPSGERSVYERIHLPLPLPLYTPLKSVDVAINCGRRAVNSRENLVLDCGWKTLRATLRSALMARRGAASTRGVRQQGYLHSARKERQIWCFTESCLARAEGMFAIDARTFHTTPRAALEGLERHEPSASAVSNLLFSLGAVEDNSTWRSGVAHVRTGR